MSQGRTRKLGSDPSVSAASARRIGFLALAGTVVMAGSAEAQGFIVRPSLSATLTYTDNVEASKDGHEDWIAELSPAIAVSRGQGRITGSLNTRLRSVMHARDSDRDATFVALDGRGQVEAVEDVLFVDMAASMSRNNTSELNGRASDDFIATDKANETRMLSLGPRLHFRLGGGAQGVVSYLATRLEGGGATVGRTIGAVRANLVDTHAFGRVGWDLDYRRSDTSYDDGSEITDSRSKAYDETARARMLLTVSPQLRLGVIAGYESNDYANRSGESSTVTGYGFEWVPTPRTTIVGQTEDRVFGRSYNLAFSHRRPLSSWNFSYARDISSSGTSASGVLDDPAFRSLYESLEAEIPDPFERENFVRQQLGYPTIGARDPFVTNNYFVARTLRGSMSLIGARNVLTFTLRRTDRSRLGDPLVSDPRDDLATFATVKTRAATISLSHNLSPRASINTSLLRSKSTGSGGGSAETTRTVLSLGLNTRLGAQTNAVVTYRHQRADGSSEFIENVLTASLNMQF